MLKTTYLNPITDKAMYFEPSAALSYKNINYKDKNGKIGFLTYYTKDKALIYVPKRKLFGDDEGYLLNRNTIKKLEVYTREELKEKSVVGRMIVGGLLMGETGAIIGGLTGMQPTRKGEAVVIINDKFVFKFDEKNYSMLSDFFFEIDIILKRKIK